MVLYKFEYDGYTVRLTIDYGEYSVTLPTTPEGVTDLGDVSLEHIEALKDGVYSYKESYFIKVSNLLYIFGSPHILNPKNTIKLHPTSLPLNKKFRYTVLIDLERGKMYSPRGVYKLQVVGDTSIVKYFNFPGVFTLTPFKNPRFHFIDRVVYIRDWFGLKLKEGDHILKFINVEVKECSK